MASTPPLKYGIVRCRDLVELWLGARLTTDYLESVYYPTVNKWLQILQPNPARIKYEITLIRTAGGLGTIFVGGVRRPALTVQLPYQVSETLPEIIISRDWLRDLDLVTAELWAFPQQASFQVNTRETVLRPLPTDEPLVS